MSPDAAAEPSTPLNSVVDGYRALLEFQESFEAPPGSDTKQFMRASLDVMNAYPPTVGDSCDVLLREVAGWQLRAEITRPRDAAVPPPVIVFFHGGGWSMGNPRTHRRLAVDLALSGCAVASIDYRRLPRHRFPAQLEDAEFAVHWAAQQAAEFGWDGTRVVVAGDSAGATLAAAVAQLIGANHSMSLSAAVLCYGIFDYHQALDLLHPSILRTAQQSGQGYLAPAEFELLRGDPRVSPLYGCSELPPTYLGVGGHDPLLPQTQAMAAALDKHGVPHELHVLPAAPHGFMQLPFLGDYLAGQLTVHDFLRRYTAPSR